MTTAEQTEDILIISNPSCHTEIKTISTMSDVCEALIVFSV